MINEQIYYQEENKPIFKTTPAFIFGLLLTIPAAYLILANITYSTFNIKALYEPILNFFQQPENKRIGLNINLLIIVGPLLALVCNTFSFLHFTFSYADNMLKMEVYFKRSPKNVFVAFFAGICLLILGGYLIFENLESLKQVGQ